MRQKILILVLLLIACYFPLFLHLENLALYSYDEARLAISAMEMLDSDNLLIPHFNGAPDMWNTKPPLMIWLQALSMKIFGANELGVRFPAAISTLITLLFVGGFCYRYLRRKYLGVFAILVLLTTPGYITTHVSRTGDYDALLILFTTLFVFTIFRYFQTSDEERNDKLIGWSAVWLSLAVLTKSTAGLLFLPAIAIYITWKKQWLAVFKTPYFYYAIGIFVSLVGAYYGLREYYNPGYLQAVWDNELGGRYLGVLENHSGPFSFYFESIWKKEFLPWLFFLPLSAVAWKTEKDQRVKDFLFFLFLAVISFLLIISLAQTKLEWYDAPIYPLLAVIGAIGIERLFFLFQANFKWNAALTLLIFCTAIFGMPYRKIISSVYLPSHDHSMNYYARFMKSIPSYKTYKMVSLGYNAQIMFYEKVYNRKGYDVHQVFPDQLNIGDFAMVCETEVLEEVNSQFEFLVLEEWKTCRLIEIIGKKQ